MDSTYAEKYSTLVRFHPWRSCNLLSTWFLSHVAQRLSHASFPIFAHATWYNKESTTFKRIVPQANLSFFMNKWYSKMPLLGTISPNSTFGGNNFLEVISHKSFSCRRNPIFIFHVWKLLPFSFSIFRALEVDVMIVNKTMPGNP